MSCRGRKQRRRLRKRRNPAYAESLLVPAFGAGLGVVSGLILRAPAGEVLVLGATGAASWIAGERARASYEQRETGVALGWGLLAMAAASAQVAVGLNRIGMGPAPATKVAPLPRPRRPPLPKPRPPAPSDQEPSL